MVLRIITLPSLILILLSLSVFSYLIINLNLNQPTLNLNPLSFNSISIMASEAVYSVWAIPPEDVAARCANLMTALRSDFSGPHFEPHITLVGAIKLTADDALAKLRSASQALKPFNVTVDRVAAGTFFYQCVYLLLRPDPHLLETSAHCCTHFGYATSTRNSSFHSPIRETKKLLSLELLMIRFLFLQLTCRT